MAHASGQFEDLIGDYFNGTSSAFSTNFSGNSYSITDLSSVNTNWGSGYIKLALATNTAGSLGARFSSFTEATGTNYTRVADDANSSGYLAMTAGSTNGEWENQYDISFPQAGSSWGTITYAIFVYDDGIDDFPLIACPLASSTAVGANTTLTFSAGDLKYTVA